MRRWRLEEGGRETRPPKIHLMPLSGADEVMTRALVRVAGHLEGQEMKSARKRISGERQRDCRKR